ncbi:MAG TPA: acyloxyacyl hydrolase [Candidatus Eisenbacteria bacterium]|nr:acyloxyacyl hydrolase [Candidatus Eisenbacteria bacterium]
MTAFLRRLTGAAAIAGAIAAASPAAAAPEAAPQSFRGSVEFTPSVSFTHQNFKREGYGNVDEFTQLNMSPTVGYYVSDRYEILGGFLVRHESINGSSDTSLGATAGLQYNFPRQGSVVPFVSAGFGALFYDGFSMNDTAVLAPMIAGGIRVPVGRDASVNMSLGYQHESNANGEFNASANRLIASVGVSLFPWR